MDKINWIKITDRILQTDGKERPISFENENYDFVIGGDEKRMMGFMIVWNISNLRAIYISRMHLKENLSFKSFEDDVDDEVPENLIFEDLT